MARRGVTLDRTGHWTGRMGRKVSDGVAWCGRLEAGGELGGGRRGG